MLLVRFSIGDFELDGYLAGGNFAGAISTEGDGDTRLPAILLRNILRGLGILSPKNICEDTGIVKLIEVRLDRQRVERVSSETPK